MERVASSPNTVLPTPDDPKALLHRDRAIDSSYIKHGSNKDEYSKEPWLHYKDAVKSYLSIRIADREAFLSNIGDDKGKIDHEIERIQKLRDSFSTLPGDSSASPGKSELMMDLEGFRKEWRAKVFEQLPEIRRERQEQLRKMKASPQFMRWLSDWDEQHLTAMKEPMSQGIGNQPNCTEIYPLPHEPVKPHKKRRKSRSTPSARPEEIPSVIDRRTPGSLPPTTNPSVVSDDDSFYGFKAGAMYFRKNINETMDGYTPQDMTKLKGIFPDQKIAMKDILTKSQDNPLTQACPEDAIRYFHFPSNNMHWIEVRSLMDPNVECA